MKQGTKSFTKLLCRRMWHCDWDTIELAKSHERSEWNPKETCDLLCVSQGLLVESLGRKALITGGYTLMSICCILITLTLSFQVIHLRTRCGWKTKDIKWFHALPYNFQVCITFVWFPFYQDASPIVPYLSMVCVFAFILSFGLGPGNWLNKSLFPHLKTFLNRCCCTVVVTS